MNKMEYQKPWAEFIQFENEDIITTSGDPCKGHPIGFSICSNGQGGNGCGFTGGGGCKNGNGSGGLDCGGIFTSRSGRTNALSLDDDPGQYGEEGETFVKDEDYVNADIDGWK